MAGHEFADRMRQDWDRRAREDAHYYVAFGRHNQDDAEFFATAYEVVYGLEYELKRFGPARDPRAMRALEIGCGPGRLMKPLARHFGEIHGVDVSPEMVERARAKLADVPHAHVHVSPGAALPMFSSESFDFVYSYAVFQHIPGREVVYSYLREARRVLKTGGLLWFQVNGLPPTGASPDTWSGVRFRPEDLDAFAREYDFQMYTLEGVDTQYMWTSLRKRPEGWARGLPDRVPETRTRIRRISNPHGTEPVVPCRGRFACASLWVENLPGEAGLSHLEVRVGGAQGTPNYIAAPLADGQQQVNVLLPGGTPTGLIPVEVLWCGRPLAGPAIMRTVPPGPCVPRLLSVTDATDILAGPRIASRNMRITFEEMERDAPLEVLLDGAPLACKEVFCSDPRPPRIELLYHLGPGVAPGSHTVELRLGRRRFPPVRIEAPEGEPLPSPH